MNTQLDLSRPHGYMSSGLTNVEDLDSVKELNLSLKKMLLDEFSIFLYLPQEFSNPKARHSDGLSSEEVYILDRWRVSESDFILINADHPSFGVGQEIEIASALGLPALVFHRTNARVSRMLRGAVNLFLSTQGSSSASDYIMTWETQEELFERIRSNLRELEPALKPERKYRGASRDFSSSLRRAREQRELSREELSQRTGFSVAFLELLEEGKRLPISLIDKYENMPLFRGRELQNVRFTNPGLWVLRKLSEALELDLGRLLGTEVAPEGYISEFRQLCEVNEVSFTEYRELLSRFELRESELRIAADSSPLSRPGVDVERVFQRELDKLREPE